MLVQVVNESYLPLVLGVRPTVLVIISFQVRSAPNHNRVVSSLYDELHSCDNEIKYRMYCPGQCCCSREESCCQSICTED